MVNFAVNPVPFIPVGYLLERTQPNTLLRHEVYLTGCYNKTNEEMAIVILTPSVHKGDFVQMATELKTYLSDVHQVHGIEIYPCPIGDAYVRFSDPFQRDRFLGQVFQFGNYHMYFVKHDEGINARSLDLDREALIMLVPYPEDLRSTHHVAKAVSGFGLLVGWDDKQAGCVIAKVYMNDDDKIPSSVKLNVGLPTKGKSWTCACFVLKKANILNLPDEEGFISTGPCILGRNLLRIGMGQSPQMTPMLVL